MKILVTGATGFIGRHLVPALQHRGHEVLALVRALPGAQACAWLESVELIEADIVDAGELDWSGLDCDALLHLAWSGLPDYRSDVHLEFNLPAGISLVRAAIDGGVRQIQIVGTCLEYGLTEGCLEESMPARPELPYAVAKARLCEEVFALAEENQVNVQWLRLFYMYGAGQNPGSLLAALDSSLESGEDSFNMSGGEQIRDYLPVEEVARYMARLIELRDEAGIFNCSSGKGVTVKRLVETYLAERRATIRLNLGFYGYPDYEPMVFWGNNERLLQALGDA